MGLLDYFKSSRKNSASLAKERLQIVIAHERMARDQPEFLPMLQQELLAVVRKYYSVNQDAVSVNMEHDDEREILELNIVLPEGGARPDKT